MKAWKAALGVSVLGLVLLIILFALGKVGVSKEAKTQPSKTQTSSSKSPLEGYNSKPNTKMGESSSSVSKSSSSVSSSSSSSSSSTSSEEKPKKTEPSSGSALTQVDYPEFTSKGSSKAVVSSKKVYKVNDSYVFCLTLTVPTEELGNVEVDYFVSNSDYNSVKVGSLLSVDYGVSTNRVVAITTARPI
jgi:hypothetical protein